MRKIGYIKTDYKSKFGVPKQSGLVNEVLGKIVFEPEYKNIKALKGLELFSHLWIIWQFSENEDYEWQPMVRPPIMGGNKKMGVFATRSPYRPNPIGMSAVKILKISQYTAEGPVIYVQGPDLMNDTPILDIKPYLPYADRIDDATDEFSNPLNHEKLEVVIPEELEKLLPEKQREAIVHVLEADPRPAYHKDSDRVYKFDFSDFKIGFKIENSVVYVTEVEKVE